MYTFYYFMLWKHYEILGEKERESFLIPRMKN